MTVMSPSDAVFMLRISSVLDAINVKLTRAISADDKLSVAKFKEAGARAIFAGLSRIERNGITISAGEAQFLEQHRPPFESRIRRPKLGASLR